VRKELEGKCIIANAGWWSYEVCYGKEVRQYHEEQDGTRPSDWSMGVFVPDDKKKADEIEVVSADTGAHEIAQHFAGGQHCDENGELRSTRVVYTCCKTRPEVGSLRCTLRNRASPSCFSCLSASLDCDNRQRGRAEAVFVSDHSVCAVIV
jgi:hypothetical protein